MNEHPDAVVVNKDDKGFLYPYNSEAVGQDAPEEVAPAKQMGYLKYTALSAWAILTCSPVNLLLPFTPIGIMAGALEWSDGWKLVLSVLGLIPWCAIMGFATEEFAEHTNDTLGGFVNATFGNIPELIICAFALRGHMIRVVRLSLLGSILSNLLLVLGSALMIGGYRYKIQQFDVTIASTNAGLLVVSVMGMLFPSVLAMSREDDDEDSKNLSRFTAGVLLVTYVAYLLFSLVSHYFLFESASGNVSERLARQQEEAALLAKRYDDAVLFPESTDDDEEKRVAGQIRDGQGAGPADLYHGPLKGAAIQEAKGLGEEEEEEGELELNKWVLLAWLAISVGFVALLSETLVSSIKGAEQDLKLPETFIAAVVLPIVGNAPEHVSALAAAYHNKLEITFGIAMGSAQQVAMFALPLMVMVAWGVGEHMTMEFGPFESTLVFASVLLVTVLSFSGKSHWLTGFVLVMAYLLLSAGFFVLRPPPPLTPGGESLDFASHAAYPTTSSIATRNGQLSP